MIRVAYEVNSNQSRNGQSQNDSVAKVGRCFFLSHFVLDHDQLFKKVKARINYSNITWRYCKKVLESYRPQGFLLVQSMQALKFQRMR
jgi:hypothetical protein